MTELKFSPKPNPYQIKVRDELGAMLERADQRRADEDAMSLDEWTALNAPNWEDTSIGDGEELARTFSAAQRRSAAKSGASLPDGSYPIFNLTDAMNALRRIGTGKASKATILAHIRKRARQLGFKAPGMAGAPS
jgi:hypothetical protein